MIELWQLPLLFLTGLVAGFVDSIAGGGGLIALPALLSCGLDPRHALGTNKFQASFGSGSAAWHYAHAGAVDLKDCRRSFALSVLGAALGTLVVQQLDPTLLRRAIPVLLIVVAIYVLLRPELGSEDRQPRMKRGSFDLLFVFGIAFYDGFFGPGAGTFWTMALVLVQGRNFVSATGTTKVLNAASNVASLAVFAVARQFVLPAVVVMAAGQLVGARVGARLVVRRGARFVQPLFLGMACVVILRLLWVTYIQP